MIDHHDRLSASVAFPHGSGCCPGAELRWGSAACPQHLLLEPGMLAPARAASAAGSCALGLPGDACRLGAACCTGLNGCCCSGSPGTCATTCPSWRACAGAANLRHRHAPAQPLHWRCGAQHEDAVCQNTNWTVPGVRGQCAPQQGPTARLHCGRARARVPQAAAGTWLAVLQGGWRARQVLQRPVRLRCAAGGRAPRWAAPSGLATQSRARWPT